MHKFSDLNNTNSNEKADMNYLIPVRSSVSTVHGVDIKVENDLSVDQGVEQIDTIGCDMENRQNMPLYVAIDEIKVEYDEPVNHDFYQENISTEHITSTVGCGSTKTEDMKFEIIQEIITPEKFTNIEMMSRSTLPTDVGVNSVKVENCGVMNQDEYGARESATNSYRGCEDVLIGEDYSSDDGLPLAETIYKADSSDPGVQQGTKIIMPIMVVQESETLNNVSVKRTAKTSAENSRAYRERKRALKYASQELDVSSFSCRLKPKPKTSTERVREFRARKRSLKNLTENVEDIQTSSNVIIADNKNNNKKKDNCRVYRRKKRENKIKKSAKSSTERVREFRARRKTSLDVEEDSSATHNDDFTVQNSESDHNDVPTDISNVRGDDLIENDVVNNDSKITVKNMAKLTDYNNTLRNETAAINYLIPATTRDVAVHDIEVKVENDLSVGQGTIQTAERIDYEEEDEQTSPLYVAIDEIKVEYDEPVNQDITDQENIGTEHITGSGMVCGSTTTEDVIHDIKAETEDHDVECGSTTTKDFVTDDVKVKIIQEIITPEKFTNIEMMCRSTVPTDTGVNSVNVDCGVTNQDGASESATDTDVQRGDGLLDEDYSLVDGLPSAETIHKVSDPGVPQVKKLSEYFMSLANDMKTHSTERPYSCAICTKTFKLKSHLKEHIDLHLGVKPYSCEICQKTFTRVSSLETHKRIHSGDKPYSCDVCRKAFIQRSRLIAHMWTHSDEKQFSCTICDKAFKVKSSFLGHIRVHTGEKPFPCDICDKAFNAKHLLYKHRRIHAAEKLFSCHICLKSFVDRSNLVKHITVHSGEKPYSCEVCHKAFNQRGQLKSHMGVHTGLKPFSCDICNRAFSTKGRLVQHIRLHSKVKPFSCEVCDKKFSKKDKLTSHMSVHSGIKPFSCQICNRAFASRRSLVSHMRKHSREKPRV